MSERWTAGPWRLGKNPHDVFGADDRGVVVDVDMDIPDDVAAANAHLIVAAPRFADIAARAQYLANERGGDYGTLTKDELCTFMAEYDAALTKARGK